MNCKIRKWKLSDAKDLAVALSNKKIQDNLRDGLPYPYSEQDGIDFISSMLSANEDETFAFAITLDDKVIGSIGVFRQQNIHRQTAEMGYYIAEEYWGKGIMTDAVKQICEYVFKNSDILRIYAEPFAYNTGSCRVLEKAGFQYEGTLRNNAVKNGKVIEGLNFSMQDATNLPYEDESFDAVMIANALHIMPEPEKALAEIRRVLKKDGLLYAPTFVHGEGAAFAFRSGLIELLGFKAYIKPTNEEFAQFIRQHGFDVMEHDQIGSKVAPLCCMIASKSE